jgi:hypothetical protein
LGSG